MEDRKRLEEEISKLEKKIEELKARIPAHSTSVEMAQELDDLENDLEKKKRLCGDRGK